MFKKAILSFLIVASFFFAIVSTQSFKQSTVSPNQLVAQSYMANFAQLKQQATLFNQLIAQQTAGVNKQAVHQSYYALRDAFKRVEYIWEYLDPIFVKEWINGAPLPKLDKAAPQLVIVEPKGLQVLDELLFADEIDIKEVQKIALELYRSIHEYPVQQKLTDRIILEGMRVELIRLFNLGLTGFDVPGSDRSLSDARIVLATIEQTLLTYTDAIQQKDGQLLKTCKEALAKGKKQLNIQTDFETFDRLTFLTTVINPLFKQIHGVQQLLGVESIYEVISLNSKLALNYNAENLFDTAFLNPFFYVNVPQKFYAPQLVELGKYLFFDPILSASNDRSCASCHNPQQAFTDGLAKSVATGFNGTVERNSPTLINAVYSERFFHDLRAEALEDQMEHVVASSKEFNTSVLEIMSKLSQSNEYQQRFKQVFTEFTSPINQQTISFAISAYVSSLHSHHSPFDKYVRGEEAQLAASAKRGFNLFMGKAACGTCHFAPNFNGTVPPLYTESESEVLGVPENPYVKPLQLDKDEGRIAAKLKEGTPFYRYSFKTPTIRNVALTSPYMHNGAYKTLEDVMDFYNHGGGMGIGLEVPYQTLSADSLHLTKQELADVISFMQALTDTTNLTARPLSLPKFETQTSWNNRKIGGNY